MDGDPYRFISREQIYEGRRTARKNWEGYQGDMTRSLGFGVQQFVHMAAVVRPSNNNSCEHCLIFITFEPFFLHLFLRTIGNGI